MHTGLAENNSTAEDLPKQLKSIKGDEGTKLADNNLVEISHYYYSPTTSQSSVIGYSREEREKLFPSNLSQVNDLNRNIAILSKPEDVVVHLPMSLQLASINWYEVD